MILYDYRPSGNGYKIRMLLQRLGKTYQYREVDIVQGESRTAEFLRRNPNGKIPVLELEDGTCLCESNAILFYLAQGTDYWPEDPLLQARVMQWLFFEQYSHEPNIASPRFWLTHLGMSPEREQLLPQKQALGYQALQVMEDHLQKNRFFAGDKVSIADLALYAYTHVAGEGGFSLQEFPHIRRWLAELAATPGHRPITET